MSLLTRHPDKKIIFLIFQIMQNALIKRKLEEQKENFRRRQEVQEKVRGTDSPLAFTPTAVMKKIAADRRDSDPVGKIPVPELKVSQSSEKENGGDFNRTSPNQGLPPCLTMIPPGSGMLPMPPLGGQQPTPNQLLLLQQQQQRMRYQAMQHQLMQQATSPTGIMEQQRLMLFQQQQHQQQQGLMQHQFGQQGFGQGRNMQQQQHHPQSRGHMMPQQQPQVGLSRFFSPEVLAQAQAGNAPAMPPLPTQKALTLEEIERQAAAVRI
jgi:translation initiation factor 4E transporter